MSKSILVAAAALAFWMVPSASEAVPYPITNCVTALASPNTNAKLMNDIVCDPSAGQIGITLNAGADLDMNGKTISCATGQLCAAAVTFTASNSIVQGGGEVHGAFSKVIGCDGKSGSRVTGLKFTGYSEYGMFNCTIVEQKNVMIGEPFGGQQSAYEAVWYSTINPTSVNDNYIRGFIIPIFFGVTAGSAGLIDHNVLISQVRGVSFQMNNGGVTVSNNILMSDDTAGTAASIYVAYNDSGFYPNNLCNTSSNACSLCIASGRCAEPGRTFRILIGSKGRPSAMNHGMAAPLKESNAALPVARSPVRRARCRRRSRWPSCGHRRPRARGRGPDH